MSIQRLRAEIDDDRQVITIEGEPFTFAFFRTLSAVGVTGALLFAERKDGALTFRTVAPDPQLDEIEARAAAATPGPWTVDFDDHRGVIWYDRGDGVTLLADVNAYDTPEYPANADFIAHAREDVQALTARVRELATRLDASQIMNELVYWRESSTKTKARVVELERVAEILREEVDCLRAQAAAGMKSVSEQVSGLSQAELQNMMDAVTSFTRAEKAEAELARQLAHKKLLESSLAEARERRDAAQRVAEGAETLRAQQQRGHVRLALERAEKAEAEAARLSQCVELETARALKAETEAFEGHQREARLEARVRELELTVAAREALFKVAEARVQELQTRDTAEARYASALETTVAYKEE